MNRAEQAQQAELFRNKHGGPRLLLLPNAWDAMSARGFVAAGFDAIATTSGGVAWSLGYADGEQTPWNRGRRCDGPHRARGAGAGHRRYRGGLR